MNKVGLLAKIGSNLVPLGGVAQELIETIVNLTTEPAADEHGVPLSRDEVLARVNAAFAPIEDVKARAEEEIRKVGE